MNDTNTMSAMITRAPFLLERPRRFAAASLAIVIVMAAGCAVSPTPLTSDDIGKRVADDRARMYAGQEPITAPLDYAQVVARVMSYNLDFRLRMMEATLAQKRLDVGNWDMMPRLLADAGYVTRNNDSGGRSIGIETGLETLTASSSQERTRGLGGLEFSWNVLDFGVSYYRAKALADTALIAEERKRKAVQNLLQDTRIAYWRALGAQRLSNDMGALMVRSNAALKQARRVEDEGLLPQGQALAYQRALLDATTLLQVRRQDLEVAKAELSALMNLAPGTDFVLADASERELPPLPADLERLETIALEQRPELREEDYRRRISVADTRRALVGVLPNLLFNAGYQYDSNKFLYNNSWLEAGLRVSTDLFRLASIPSIRRAGDAALAVDDTRRLAQAMAVLTQVRVAALRYGLAREELETMEASAQVDQRMAAFARASASSRVDSELELIRTEARAMLSSYQRQIAYANAQNAWGRLYNSLGMDLTPGESLDIDKLSALVGTSLSGWHETVFRRPMANATPGEVRLVLDGVDGDLRDSVRDGLKAALHAQGLIIRNDFGTAHALHVTAAMKPDASGGALGIWQMVLSDADGRALGKARYEQRIADLTDRRHVQQVARAAVAAYGAFIGESIQTARAATAELAAQTK